ncbi:MAG: RNA-binding protein [Thermoplasmata archaeon]|nr:RNA-binding protein [Thermoplasmata archaeon]
MYLITRWFGTFLCNEKGEIKDCIIFPKNVEDILERMKGIDEGKILDEEKRLASKTREKIIVSEKRLEPLGKYKPEDDFFIIFNVDFRKYGFSKEILNEVMRRFSDFKADKILSKKDIQIINSVRTLDDLIEINNLLLERISEWKKLKDVENKTFEILKSLQEDVSEKIKEIERNIKLDMEDVAPNIANIAGPIIGARLISLAGSLDKLARMPASTIQLLGAEKAFFRYKKEGGRPPKHGILFRHPLVSRTSYKKRGKIARLLADKIAIAAKADRYTGKLISDSLKEKIDLEVKRIRKT